MPSYIALLRGINVGRTKIIAMAKLRESSERIGLKNVRTYINSGNLLFDSPERSEAKLAKILGGMIQKDFGFEVPVILRTPAELESALKRNPYPKGADPAKIGVVFLSETPPKSASKKLDELPKTSDQYKLAGRELYLNCPNGFGKSKLAAVDFGKLLSTQGTMRNLKTVAQLLELSEA